MSILSSFFFRSVINVGEVCSKIMFLRVKNIMALLRDNLRHRRGVSPSNFLGVYCIRELQLATGARTGR